MEKKKLLILGYTLDLGGAEKALIDLLKNLSNKIDIDLYLFKKVGPLVDLIPDNVKTYELKNNKFEYAFFRYFPLYRENKINKIYNQKKYDYVVGFMEGRSATWVSDIKSDYPKKYAWVHTDVARFGIGISDNEAKKSYNNLDKIICVSEEAKNSFCTRYGVNPDKVMVIYNYIDEAEILKKAHEFNHDNKVFTFVNVAVMRPEKRHDRLVMAAKYLKDKGYKFKIELVGGGANYDKISEMIKELGVDDCVTLLGYKTNPYPYIFNADCFVSSSMVEGYGIALKEALFLKKRIITTDTVGPREILSDGKYGIIVENDDDALKYAMEDMLNNPKKYSNIDKELLNYKSDNDIIKKKTLKLFDL